MSGPIRASAHEIGWRDGGTGDRGTNGPAGGAARRARERSRRHRRRTARDRPPERRARRGRLRASAHGVRRHDAHEGRVSGGQSAQPHRLRGAALQLPRRRRERGQFQRRSWRDGRFSRGAGFHERAVSGRQAMDRGHVLRLVHRADRRRRRPARVDAHRHRAADLALRLRAGRAQHEGEVLHPGRARRNLPAQVDARILRTVRGAKGAGRDRRRGSFVRRQGQRGRRRDRRSVGGLVMKDAVIVSAARTAVGKAPGGTLRGTRPDELAAAAIGEALKRAPGIDPKDVDDVILGCAMPEAEQGMNVARIASLRAGIPVEASAVTVNRFCSSGLQAIAYAAERVMCGFASTIVAGGTESMSLVPMGGHKIAPNPTLIDRYPDVYLSTGLVAENHARESGISPDEQDAFALRSHQRAIAAIDSGRFRDEITPLAFSVLEPPNDSRPPRTRQVTFAQDEGPRRDTSLEALAKLKPAFHAMGTVTAGNSSQTSDGAAAAVVMSVDKAKSLGLKPLARFVSFATAGTLPEEMGVGPVFAIPRALKLAGLKLSDIDLVELNEAFAAQTLSVIKLAGLDPEKTNTNGGAVALGHPLGCTGAKLTATLLGEMKRRKSRYGMVTMCVGGGMGAAGVFENLQS